MESQEIVNDYVDRQLVKHEELILSISECNIKLTEMMERTSFDIRDHEKRLRKMESKDGEFFKKIALTILTSAVTAFITVLLGGGIL